ncbi:MAG: tagaturonate epimerase family protein, partial [Candidatus Sumerlaeota bacterium]|nr:tagaturonate epimerase family protein [Candidatus Sumerlaeota bacterium]
APRFVGSFEKGIDYIGDLNAFGAHLKTHAEIARALGPYKLSVHSGSDKFSIYPMLGRTTGGLLHLKTAGTSYLEALRIPARHDPALFRAIARRAIEHFPEARASYHLSTDISEVPDPDRTSDADLERRFLDAPEANAARQVLHVAYGDVLNGPVFAPSFLKLLDEHPDEHAADIARHMKRHLTAFQG